LRERLEDIPDLAAHFTMRAAKRLGLPPLVPTTEDIRLLAAYAWPGNVRELSAVLERAAILGNGKRLEVARALGTAASARQSTAPQNAATLAEQASLVTSLDAAMARHIELALTQCRGRIEGEHGAARLLKINPHTLRARMRKLGIDWQRFRVALPGSHGDTSSLR
jgi:DNA-binding NtrC family response regulator